MPHSRMMRKHQQTLLSGEHHTACYQRRIFAAQWIRLFERNVSLPQVHLEATFVKITKISKHETINVQSHWIECENTCFNSSLVNVGGTAGKFRFKPLVTNSISLATRRAFI